MAQIVFTLEDGTIVEAALDADLITLGRRPDSMVVLASGSVSGHHATIKRRGDNFYVQDMGTTNGTKLNGVEIEEAKLSDGDHLTFGDISGVVHLTDDVQVVAIPTPLPEPAEPVVTQLPASAYLPDRYSSKPSARKPKAPKPSMPIKQYKQSSGCGGFLLFLLFLVFAFVVGLHVRHGQEHDGRVLILDVLKKFRGELEKAAEQNTAPAPASESAPKSTEEASAPSM